MSVSENTALRPLLVLCEAIIVFFAGVFGNKLADLFNMGVPIIILGLIVIMILLYFITLARIRSENNQTIIPRSLKQLNLQRITTIFPAAAGLGALSGSLSSVVFSSEILVTVPLHLGIWANSLNIWRYELGAFILGVLLIYLFSARHSEKALVFGFGMAFAFGASTTLVLLYPYENAPAWTLSGWMLAMLGAATMVSSAWFHKVIDGVRSIFSSGSSVG